MIKNECKIVRDLLPNYVEDLTSKETKEFIENHIEACKECKDILDLLKGDKKEEKQKEERGEEEEIKHLKKYNRRMTILKSIAVVLAIFIIASLPITITKKIKEKKNYDEAYARGKYAYDIIQTANNKLKEIEQATSIEYSSERGYRWKEQKNRSKTIYKYKDEKATIKETHYYKNIEGATEESITTRYDILSEDKLETLQINEFGEEAYTSYSGDYYHQRMSFEGFLSTFEKLSIIECSTVKVREEEYEGKKCYVLRYGTEEYYTEIWIEKETNYILKRTQTGGNLTYEEVIYTWSVDTVTDENIFDGYTKEEIQNKINTADKHNYYYGG